MSMLDFPIFDADNHYYEATDAFTRHLDKSMRKRTMQWATIDGRPRLLVAGAINRFIPNPAFTHLAQPGSLVDFFRAKQSNGGDLREAFGVLQPIEDRPEYRNRDARLAVMDGQGLEATIMLPTLGVGMEKALEHDGEAVNAAFTAFNRWVQEDWGFNYQNRIYAAPYISLMDVDWAVRELDFAIENNAGVILMRPASVQKPFGRVTPGHVSHDAFWSRLNESGVTLVFHGGDSSYTAYEQLWGLAGNTEAFRSPVLRRMLSASPIRDTMASIIADQLFDRFPNIRIATIETGSDWVAPLVKKLKAIAIQMPGEFGGDPYELFHTHVTVSPFFEDNVIDLVNIVGADHVVFGSDWPHVEGLAEPSSFIKELDGVADDDVQKIMHHNARALVTPRPI
jgi:predicted TIM-barrel fold metal-dependent hydrolase